MRSLLQRLDAFQRERRWLAFPFAVVKKYSDDQGGYLAATVTYYAFFATFPLLLVFVSGLGYVLRGHAHLQQRILASALGQFPVVGHDLQVHGLRGSAIALVLGAAASLWAGMGVFLAAENAMDLVWGVPRDERPGFVPARLRALALLVLLGTGALAATIVSSIASTGTSYAIGWKIGAVVLSIALDFGLFWVALRLLTTKDVSWRMLRGGAISAAIAYEILQLVGGYYVDHVVKSASDTYGTFALVIGLLSWIYLSAHILLLVAEGNVVATRRLWPRSLL
ncbi:MAG TPA: YihY/virulence factor BrkB family protein [Gaiellaceae bacterium]|nr:YihY/virulence factor BrkB family protein [Gaiellaceae bacterium]